MTSQVRVVVPLRHAAVLAGDLGQLLARTLVRLVNDQRRSVRDATVTRLPRALLVECATADGGDLLEATHAAVRELEAAYEATYPVFAHELGALWTGSLQVVYPDALQRGA